MFTIESKNLHVDKTTSTAGLQSLLDSFGLRNFVGEPTGRDYQGISLSAGLINQSLTSE
jgi:hypothetical protein